MAVKLKPLAEQVIVITGASSGIGLATARAAARKGAAVLLAARDGEALERISSELNAEGCRTAFHVTDVSVEQDVKALADAAIRVFGGFDTWVNNAAVGIVGKIEDVPSADHHKIFETNYFGVVYGSLEAVRHFRDAGKSGALINLGSVVSDMPMALSVAYAATKHAIKGFTDGLRIELQREDLPVSVTLIKPSGIDTPFFDHARTLTPGIGKAPGPNYAPSVVADAILYAAQHPKRDIGVGATAAVATLTEAAVPGAIDRLQRHMSITDLIDFGHAPSGDNLYTPEGGHERSRYGSGKNMSVTTFAQTRGSTLLGTLGVIAGLGAVTLLVGRKLRA